MSGLVDSSDDLISGFLRQSYAGAVRQRLLEIERAVQSGQRHEGIVLGMKQQGMVASIGTFRKSLSRARIWWRKQLLDQLAERQTQGEDQALDLSLGEQATATPLDEPQMPPPMTQANVIAKAAGPASRSKPTADVRRINLDEFFKTKSVFTKT
jgi:hypothetical protein